MSSRNQFSSRLKRTLLLNSNYETLSFISEQRLWKLMYCNKIDVLETWNDQILWKGAHINHPSVVILKTNAPFFVNKTSFNRKVLIVRDDFTCQYCGKKLFASQVTIDHVIPRKFGGRTSYTNCVVACYSCNNRKSDKMLADTNMKLLNKPTMPSNALRTYRYLNIKDNWNQSWNKYLSR